MEGWRFINTIDQRYVAKLEKLRVSMKAKSSYEMLKKNQMFSHNDFSIGQKTSIILNVLVQIQSIFNTPKDITDFIYYP